MGKRIGKWRAGGFVLLLSLLLLVEPSLANASVHEEANSQILANAPTLKRFAGQTRYGTARAIAEQYQSGKVQHVILASGNNFPDALASSVLAAKRQAPVLLVDSSVESSSEAFAYIRDHLDPSGTVTVTGGTGVIPVEFLAHLRSMGYANIVQLGGQDRYETAKLVAEQVDAATGTPVVMTTGEDFPEALTISSFAAAKGWSALMPKLKSLPYPRRPSTAHSARVLL